MPGGLTRSRIGEVRGYVREARAAGFPKNIRRLIAQERGVAEATAFAKKAAEAQRLIMKTVARELSATGRKNGYVPLRVNASLLHEIRENPEWKKHLGPIGEVVAHHKLEREDILHLLAQSRSLRQFRKDMSIYQRPKRTLVVEPA